MWSTVMKPAFLSREFLTASSLVHIMTYKCNNMSCLSTCIIQFELTFVALSCSKTSLYLYTCTYGLSKE